MGGYRLSAIAGRVGNHFLASPAEESSLKMLCPAFKRGLTPFILIALSIIASCTPQPPGPLNVVYKHMATIRI